MPRRPLVLALATVTLTHAAVAQSRSGAMFTAGRTPVSTSTHTVTVEGFTRDGWSERTAVSEIRQVIPWANTTATFRTLESWGLDATVLAKSTCAIISDAWAGLGKGALVAGVDDCASDRSLLGVGEITLAAGVGETLTLHDFLLGLRQAETGLTAVQIYDLGTGKLLWTDTQKWSADAGALMLAPSLTSSTGFVLQYGLTGDYGAWKDASDGLVGLNNMRLSAVLATPEPSGTALLATGLGLTVVVLRRRRA